MKPPHAWGLLSIAGLTTACGGDGAATATTGAASTTTSAS
jgi:hypothetical protein